MAGKNYYTILETQKSASPEEIKKAYRKLALKYHPDRNKGDKSAEARFKDISEAYAVLSDPEKKKEYDMFGAEGFHNKFSQEDIFRGFDFGNIFSEMGFGGRGNTQNAFSQMFGGMGGGGRCNYQSGGSPFGGSSAHGQVMKGQDLVYELSMTLEELCTTTNKAISYQMNGRPENVSVKIPAGIASGQKLRLSGKGQPNPMGGPPGDLYIQIRILNHPVFERKDDDLHMKQQIKFSDAVLGTKIEIQTIDKKWLKLKIPPGTQNNAKLRARGYGMPRMKGQGRGDAYAQISIIIPKELDRKQKSLVTSLAKAGL